MSAATGKENVDDPSLTAPKPHPAGPQSRNTVLPSRKFAQPLASDPTHTSSGQSGGHSATIDLVRGPRRSSRLRCGVGALSPGSGNTSTADDTSARSGPMDLAKIEKRPSTATRGALRRRTSSTDNLPSGHRRQDGSGGTSQVERIMSPLTESKSHQDISGSRTLKKAEQSAEIFSLDLEIMKQQDEEAQKTLDLARPSSNTRKRKSSSLRGSGKGPSDYVGEASHGTETHSKDASGEQGDGIRRKRTSPAGGGDDSCSPLAAGAVARTPHYERNRSSGPSTPTALGGRSPGEWWHLSALFGESDSEEDRAKSYNKIDVLRLSDDGSDDGDCDGRAQGAGGQRLRARRRSSPGSSRQEPGSATRGRLKSLRHTGRSQSTPVRNAGHACGRGVGISSDGRPNLSAVATDGSRGTPTTQGRASRSGATPKQAISPATPSAGSTTPKQYPGRLNEGSGSQEEKREQRHIEALLARYKEVDAHSLIVTPSKNRPA